jgi:hypothetical protein
VPPEELDTHFSLERPNPLAHGSGGNPELDSGAREIAVPDASSQHAQRVERGQSFAHVSFEAVLQMIVKSCGHDLQSDPIHYRRRS